MQIDISPLVQGALTVAAGCIASCIPLATAWLGRSLRLQNNTIMLTQLAAAIRAGGGIAYHFLATQAARPCSVDIRNAALAAGVRQVIEVAPAALSTLGISQAGLEALVMGELGRLLASDPTVAVNGPTATTVTKP